jgi:hypothetical protein
MGHALWGSSRRPRGNAVAIARRARASLAGLCLLLILSGPLLPAWGKAETLTAPATGRPAPPALQKAEAPPLPCGLASLGDLKWALRGERLSPQAGTAASQQEMAMTELQQAARAEGLTLTPVEISLDSLANLGVPVVGHFKVGKETHFASWEVGSGWVRFLSPAGARVVPWSQVQGDYTGRALVEEQALRNALPTPLIEADESLKDLGAVRPGRLVTRAFVLRNRTEAPVRITRVECPPDCKATLAPGTEIAPGKMAWLSVTWKPLAPASDASQQRHVVLVTDHPGRRVYLFSLLASISG